MWTWSGLINQWRALGGLSLIANKGGAYRNGRREVQQGWGQDGEPALQGCPWPPAHSACDWGATGAAQLLTLHLPAAWWACRVKEAHPPNVPGVSQHLHPLWNRSYFSMSRKSCTQHGICRVTAVGSRLSPGNYFIISLSAQSCKRITFIADFVYTSVY